MARVAKKRRSKRNPPATWAIYVLRVEARKLRGDVRIALHTVRHWRRRQTTRKKDAESRAMYEAELTQYLRLLNDIRKALIALGD